MRSFATALLLYLLVGMAGAQCFAPEAFKAALAQDLVGATKPQPIQVVQPDQGAFVRTVASPAARIPHPAPAGRIAAPAPATRIAQAAPRGSAQGTHPATARSPGSAALYAAIAVMAAIALRRRSL